MSLLAWIVLGLVAGFITSKILASFITRSIELASRTGASNQVPSVTIFESQS